MLVILLEKFVGPYNSICMTYNIMEEIIGYRMSEYKNQDKDMIHI